MTESVVWVFGSGNPHKLAEVAALLAQAPIHLEPLPAGVEVPPEDGNTLLANARIKARAAARATGKVALADDTGLEVDAIGGDPGVYSARFAGENATFDDNNRLLLERLRGIHGVNRRARFRCVFVLADPEGKEVSAEGRIEGFIQEAPRGTHGFGYDPLFVPEGSERTLAELGAEEKNAISHRARAAAALLEAMRGRGRWTP
ncbi:MAG TPA: RdgB/HAM1 family non-canonical purine NTP pyrophosphatase [Candidatus Eisenbacteria bacterium]|nr:RdgB/HAM1 family non-canonical purine NTP pyrophosphatase [Candidatus Eisenbacteria bacterium]